MYNRNEYNYTRDELFSLAKETTEQKNRQVEVKVSGKESETLYVALISAEGDLICSQEYDSTFDDRLFADDAENIEYVNGTLDDVSAEAKNGKIIAKDSSNQSGSGTIYIYMGVSELVDGIKAKTVLLQMEKHRLIYQIRLESQETM